MFLPYSARCYPPKIPHLVLLLPLYSLPSIFVGLGSPRILIIPIHVRYITTLVHVENHIEIFGRDISALMFAFCKYITSTTKHRLEVYGYILWLLIHHPASQYIRTRSRSSALPERPPLDRYSPHHLVASLSLLQPPSRIRYHWYSFQN